MANQIVRMAYAIVSAAGIDTSNMTPQEVIDKMNEIDDTPKKETSESEQDRKIRNINDEIKNLTEERTPKETKEISVIIDKNTGKYVKFTPTGITLTDDKDLATVGKNTEKILRSTKALKKLGIEPEQSTAKIERDKFIPYAKQQAISEKIDDLVNRREALREGYGEDVDSYLEAKQKKHEERIKQQKENIQNSYYGKAAKSNMEKYYDEDGRIVIASDTAMELFERRAKALGAEIIHSSAKKGEGKYDASIYLKIGNTEVRLSNHEIPDTAERNLAKAEGRTSRWDSEVIMDKPTLDEMIKNKTQKEFDNWVKSYFND